MRGALALLACLAAGPTLAHGGEGPQWAPDPWTLAGLLLGCWLYGRGLFRLWSRAGRGRAIGTLQAVSFAAGLAIVAAALVTPLDALADLSFAAHMVQHMLLAVVAPPLLLLGTPMVAYAAALPNAGKGMARAWRAVGGRRLEGPAVAALLQAVALWAWHAPAAYEAALADRLVHTLEHACFLATALLFWAAVLNAGRRGSASRGVATLAVLATVVQGGFLGALLTFAPMPLYPSYGDLEDQQLAGLIMWVPAGMAHTLAGLWLVRGWLEPDPGRSEARLR